MVTLEAREIFQNFYTKFFFKKVHKIPVAVYIKKKSYLIPGSLFPSRALVPLQTSVCNWPLGMSALFFV